MKEKQMSLKENIELHGFLPLDAFFKEKQTPATQKHKLPSLSALTEPEATHVRVWNLQISCWKSNCFTRMRMEKIFNFKSRNDVISLAKAHFVAPLVLQNGFFVGQNVVVHL
jgi:hypothetical protein